MVTVKRLDHLEIIAGVIKDVGIIDTSDARIVPDDQKAIPTGGAIAGMVPNGLGFSDRPLSLTPQFFATKPVALLGREGVSAMQFTSLDPTSFPFTGAYVSEMGTQAVAITRGYAEDHWSNLQQAVLEWMVSQGGGVSFMSQRWDGNASHTVMFRERCEALIAQCEASETSQYVIADAKWATETHVPNVAHLPFLTRMPETSKGTQQVIKQAWAQGEWQPLDETVRSQRADRCHDSIAPQWLGVSSQDAARWAATTLAKGRAQEHEQVQKQLFHLQVQRFAAEETALDERTGKLQEHQVVPGSLTSHIPYVRKGRPTQETPITAIWWQMHADVLPASAKMTHRQQHKAYYKGQSAVERSLRFLKDLVFCVSPLWVKKSSCLPGLLMVITLPTQIGQPTSRPARRWVFQRMEGSNRVTFFVQGHVKTVIEGLTALRRKILQLFRQKVCQLYQISPGQGLLNVYRHALLSDM